MNLLEQTLPNASLRPKIPLSEFFDRCEALALDHGYNVDRRKEYAGPGYDQLNLHLAPSGPNELMVRMVSTPQNKDRVQLDVVTRWSNHPINWDEYVTVLKSAYRRLLGDYAARYNARPRLGISRRPQQLDLDRVDCGRIEYAQGKFREAVRSMAVGAGDVRARLRSAFLTIHVIRPDDLPPPLKGHLEWVVEQLTWRSPRYEKEGTLDATLAQMRCSTGAKIADRILALADALDELYQFCVRRRVGP